MASMRWSIFLSFARCLRWLSFSQTKTSLFLLASWASPSVLELPDSLSEAMQKSECPACTDSG